MSSQKGEVETVAARLAGGIDLTGITAGKPDCYRIEAGITAILA